MSDAATWRCGWLLLVVQPSAPARSELPMAGCVADRLNKSGSAGLNSCAQLGPSDWWIPDPWVFMSTRARDTSDVVLKGLDPTTVDASKDGRPLCIPFALLRISKVFLNSSAIDHVSL